MKLNGFLTGSGKIGSIVVSKVNGQTIAREYNPNVSNPSTQAQVNQRARLKIAAQLAAVMSPNIAIARVGALSGRNAFIKKAMNFIYASNGQAIVSYENLQLTDGSISLPAISLDRSSNAAIAVELAESAIASVDRMVYVGYKVTTERQLQYIGSTVVLAGGNEGKFPGTLPYTDAQVVVYAYGLKDVNASASALYGNYSITNGEDVAKLLGNRSVSAGNFQATATRGTSLLAGETSTVVLADNECRLFLTAVGSGAVSGAGVKIIGSEVTVTATPNANANFLGWKVNGTSSYISTSASYTFTITGQTDLIAEFEQVDPNAVTLDVSTQNTSLGLVRIGAAASSESDYDSAETQTFAPGTSVTVSAQAQGSAVFNGWFIGGQLVSNSQSYSFTINEDTSIEASFMAL